MTYTELIKQYTDYIATIGNVKKWTIKTTAFVVDKDKLTYSSTPFSLEQAERIMVFFTYEYTVVSNFDHSFFVLFADKNGFAENYMNIGGWEISFPTPITSAYYTNGGVECTMKRNDLKIELRLPVFNIKDNIDNLWAAFKLVRESCSQRELDLIKMLYDKETDLREMKKDNIYLTSREIYLDSQLDSYRDLIAHIKKISNYNN